MRFSAIQMLCLTAILSATTGFAQLKKNIREDNDTIRNSAYHPELKKFYDDYNVDGMFVAYSLKKKNYIFYNPSFYRQPMSPASTFNILLTLIGLQEGVVSDEKSLLRPDNSTLEYAFKHNVDSCFINLSLLIGQKKIQYWLDKINYGNRSTSGESARFWINGFLQITPEQQLRFIQKVYSEQIPFSKKAFGIVKKLMDESMNAGSGIKIAGKRGSNKVHKENKYTGNLYNQDKYTGWFVGYVEGANDTWFFVNYIESPDLNHLKIVNAQKEIVFKLVDKLGLK
jgi:beta-lactamase class D